MEKSAKFDAWSAGQNYEHYMGRWSRQMAGQFLEWLAPPSDAAWLDIGCGTGALTATILAQCAPRSVLSIDPSEGFLAHARSTIADNRAHFEVAGAQALPVGDATVDVAVSALVMNFVPDRQAALTEMLRVLKPIGLLAFYVWDYPNGGIGFIDVFWKAAAGLDPAAAALDEAKRFPFCTREGLAEMCRTAGLRSIVVEPLEIETVFPDFEAFWQPFTLGAGPAPGYCASLSEEGRTALKAALADKLGPGRPIRLPARAWAVKAR